MKKVLVFFLVFLVFIFVGCTSKESVNPSNTKPYMTGIQAVNSNGVEIQEDVEYQTENTEYTHRNVRVYAMYSDESRQDVTPFATFSEASLALIGEFEIVITLKEFSTNYILKVLENSMDHIEVSYATAKLEYQVGEQWLPSEYILTAFYKNGASEKITEYNIQILDKEEKEISLEKPFSEAGEYKVQFRYGNLTTFYKINVLQTEIKFEEIRFDSSSLEKEYYGTTPNLKSIRGYGRTIDQKEIELSTEDWEAEILYQGEIVSNFSKLGEYEIRLSYLKECNGNKSSSLYIMYSPYSSLELELSKTFYQEDEVVDLDHLKVYGRKEEKRELLENEMYKISLSYEETEVASFKEDGFYEIRVAYALSNFAYRNSTSILYSSVSLTENLEAIDSAEIIEQASIFSDAFSFSLESFLKETPSGFLLSGVWIKDQNGTLIQDIAYDGVSTNLAVTGLEANTEYLVQPYYDLALSTYSIRDDITLGYRIHFVGFVILTSFGGTKTHRVRLMYENLPLYTVLVSHGESIPYVFLEKFLLPIQYETYECVGTKEDLTNITSDHDIEVVLIPRREQEEFSVIFYNQFYRILKVEKVLENGTATPPEIENEIIGADGRTYTFTGWSKEYTNVVKTLKLVAKYVDLTNIIPVFRVDSYVTSKNISLEFSIKNYTNCQDYIESYEVYLVVSDQEKSFLGKAENLLNYRKLFFAKDLKDFTNYTIEVIAYYRKDDVLYTSTTTYDFKTMKAKEEIPNVVLTIQDTTYQSISVQSNSKEIEGIFCMQEETPLQFQTDSLNNMSATLSRLKHNTMYAVGYYTRETIDENYTCYWLYDEVIEATTLDENPPILPDRFYVIFYEYVAEIYIPMDTFIVSPSLVIQSLADVEYFEFSTSITENVFQHARIEEGNYVFTIEISKPAPTEEPDFYMGHFHTLHMNYFFDDFFEVRYFITDLVIEWNGFLDVVVFQRMN